jgi:hypothetical protein
MPLISNTPSVSRQEIARAVLRYGTATRQQIGRVVRLSPARITTHARWLLDHDLLRIQRTRLPHADRPVEHLSLNPESGTGLGLLVDATRVSAHVVAFDASPLADHVIPVARSDRVHVAQAITEAIRWASKVAATMERQIDAVCMAVDGHVGLHTGLVVYDIEGVSDWRPCDLQKTLEVFCTFSPSDTRHFCSCPVIMCKVKGHAEQLNVFHKVGYFDFNGRRFRDGKLDNGRVSRGYMGIDGGVLHISDSDEGPLCFCGRRNCLAQLLETGQPIPVDRLARHVAQFACRQKLKHVAIEWHQNPDKVRNALLEAGIASVTAVDDPIAVSLRGLRRFAAEVSSDLVIARCLGKEKGSGLDATRLSRDLRKPKALA